MKQRTATIVLAIILLMLVSALSWAKGTPNVANGIHNLSSSGLQSDGMGGTESCNYASNTSEICVFCHTPHGGLTVGPLWNRNLSTDSITHYSSTTLTLTTAGILNGRAVGDESRLCLSCHDGTSALDHLINPPNTMGGVDIEMAGGFNDMPIVFAGAVIGGNLSDDHPISFSYDTIHDQTIYSDVNGGRAGELHTIAEAKAAGVRFFNGGSNGNNRVECSSCHDPHVDYLTPGTEGYTPFLMMPNAGSNLCRACHNK